MTGIDRVLIIGGSGGFGRAFAAALGRSGAHVTTVDVAPGADIECDPTTQPQRLAAPLAGADLVLLCLPQGPAMAALTALGDAIAAGALVVDVCSVKSPICRLAAVTATQAEYVSLHPMFAPERGFEGGNAVVVPIRSGPRAAAWLGWLRAVGLHVIETDADTHDRVASLVQVVTHAMLASFAAVRASIDAPEAMVQAFATPNFAELDNLSQRMLRENPELYHNIQTANPHGETARRLLLDGVSATLRELAAPDAAAAVALFERLRRD